MAKYNAVKYNTDRYNANFQTWLIELNEDLPLSKFSGYNTIRYNTANYNDGYTIDELTKSISMSLTESQFLQDNNTGREISKGFTEEMRLAAWLTIKRKNSAQWSDQ